MNDRDELELMPHQDLYGPIKRLRAALLEAGAALDELAAMVSIADEPLLSRSVDTLDLPPRMAKALRLYGFDKLGKVVRYHRYYFIRMHGVGKGSVDALEAKLEEVGLRFAKKNPPGEDWPDA